jgi:hypothetical protein
MPQEERPFLTTGERKEFTMDVAKDLKEIPVIEVDELQIIQGGIHNQQRAA